jgi:hypothetical protein
MKKKFLIPVFALLAIAMSVFFACSKNNNRQSKDATNESANAKFKSNEWPTFIISKESLAGYFADNNTDKVITVIMRSDVSNPKSSMELVGFGIGAPLTFTQDANNKTELDKKLGIGNNLISLNQISAICRTNGKWIDNFEYLRLTPIESTQYRGYLAFALFAFDKDGNLLQSTNFAGRSLTGDSESNPCPPACPPGCPTGYHNDTYCHCVPD